MHLNLPVLQIWIINLLSTTWAAEPPKVNPFSFLKRWRTGETTSVTCVVSTGTAPFKFLWMKDGHELKESSNARVKDEQRYSMLLIEPVDTLSGGNYTCVVKNRAGLDSYTSFLDVEGPPRWVRTMGDTRIAYGSEARLECEATGSPMPIIRWEKLQEQSQSWFKVNTEGQSLEIPKVTFNETGTYRCSADNGVSPHLEHILILGVYGKFNKKQRTQRLMTEENNRLS